MVQDVLGWRGSGSQVTGVDGCGSIVYGSFTFVLFCSFLAEVLCCMLLYSCEGEVVLRNAVMVADLLSFERLSYIRGRASSV